MADKEIKTDVIIIEKGIIKEWELLDPQAQPQKKGLTRSQDEEQVSQEPDGVIDLERRE